MVARRAASSRRSSRDRLLRCDPCLPERSTSSRRAQEWTAGADALVRQPADLIAFTGRCLVHRAEIMQVHGDWSDALEEAGRASRRLVETRHRSRPGWPSTAWESSDASGEFEAAEDAYRARAGTGGSRSPASRSFGLRRAGETRRRRRSDGCSARRAEPLEACRRCCRRSSRSCSRRATSRRPRTRVPRARASSRSVSRAACSVPCVAQARGAVELARAIARGARPRFGRPPSVWQELEAPYEVARTRELIGARLPRGR